MCWKKNFAVITFVVILLLSNIVASKVFGNIPLERDKNTKAPSTDAANSPTLQKGNFNLNPKSSAKSGSMPSSFDSLWWFNNHFAQNTFRGSDTSFSGFANYTDYIVSDDDSVQLIIGVDYTKVWAYENVAKAAANFQGKIINTVSMKGKVIAVVADVPLDTVSSFTEQISKNPVVRYVEPNMKRRALFEPNDPYWGLQWGPKKIEANWAWNKTLGSSSITVAVVDTGIDYNHPDLIENYVEGGYDWINDDPDPLDDFGHGTHLRWHNRGGY
jgi:subtilisin family serine protease